MSSRENSKNLKGQILLITLFVLTIMAILLVMTIRIIITDTDQAVSSRDFEIFYNVSESITQDYIEGFSDASLTELQTECAGSSYNARTIHECSFLVDPDTLTKGSAVTGQTTVESKVTVEEKSLVEIELAKDESFSLELTERLSPTTFISYTGSVQVQWVGNDPIALEIMVIYFNDRNGDKTWNNYTEEIAVSYAVVDSGNFLAQVPTNSYTITRAYDSVQNKTTITVPISTAMNYPAGLTYTSRIPKSMVIIPRMNTETREFTIKTPNHLVGPNVSHPWPVQIREITTETFDNSDPDSPVSKVTSKVPRFPQVGAFFYYSLLTENTVNLP